MTTKDQGKCLKQGFDPLLRRQCSTSRAVVVGVEVEDPLARRSGRVDARRDVADTKAVAKQAHSNSCVCRCAG